MSRDLLLCLLAVLVAGCRQPPPVSAAPAESVSRLESAEVVGLPPLAGTDVRHGTAEYRFELGCGACLPDYLVQIRESRHRIVSVSAYLLWFAPPSPEDSSHAARNMRERPSKCAGELQPASPRAQTSIRSQYTWCRLSVPSAGEWTGTVRALDSLGMLSPGTADGYRPTPPGFVRDTVLADGRRGTIIGGGCNDIGGTTLEIESAGEGGYRNAHFWCLERPSDGEHGRAAAAHGLLAAMLGIR